MTIPKIYSNFNTWCDNQQRIGYFKQNYSTKELEKNEKYQNLVASTPSVFDLNQKETDVKIETLKNKAVSSKSSEIFNKITGSLDELNDFTELNKEDNYEKNVANLGQGELLEKDTDKNNSLSMDEYIASELADLEEDATIEDKAITAAYSQALFQILDKGTAVSDENGELNAEELASFYRNVDRFENGILVDEGTADGVFSADDAANFIPFLVDNMIGTDNINALYDYYYQKYSLEDNT